MRIVSRTCYLTKVYVPRCLTFEESLHCMLQGLVLKKWHKKFTYLIIYLHKIRSSSQEKLAATAAMCKINNAANRFLKFTVFVPSHC